MTLRSYELRSSGLLVIELLGHAANVVPIMTKIEENDLKRLQIRNLDFTSTRIGFIGKAGAVYQWTLLRHYKKSTNSMGDDINHPFLNHLTDVVLVGSGAECVSSAKETVETM